MAPVEPEYVTMWVETYRAENGKLYTGYGYNTLEICENNNKLMPSYCGAYPIIFEKTGDTYKIPDHVTQHL